MSPATSMRTNPPLKALFFDVFGTCVDWRKTVTDALFDAGQAATGTKASQLTKEQWGDFAQEWRNSYLQFTRSVATDPSLAWKTVDQHHEESLHDLLGTHDLTEGFTTSQIHELSLIWHRLDPWADTNTGLALLNDQGLQTCTLSNGNMALLEDMCRHSGMPFTRVFSAELFQSYKPNSKVYLGAAGRLGLEPGECAMVAAHLGDLRAAKSFGLQTIYVERPLEERNPELRSEGFVDLWVGADEDGFVSVAKRLAERVP